ncbi:MAG: DUF6242 domain-containing protein [Candidatus Buchananbacteria bacterium]
MEKMQKSVLGLLLAVLIVCLAGCPLISSGNANILSFSIIDPPSVGVISDYYDVVILTVPYGTDVAHLTPQVGISRGAHVFPASGSVTDFSSPVIYTVTADNGMTARQYRVSVQIVYKPVNWQEMPSPVSSEPSQIIHKLLFLRGEIFAVVQNSPYLYQSHDDGQSWQIVETGLNVGNFWDIDIDGANLYVGTGGGLINSTDGGNTFSWVFQWGWDPVSCVSFENGYGWGWIGNWGSRSGVWRKDPAADWVSVSRPNDGGMNGSLDVFADPFDPEHIAYVEYCVMTTDGGQSWSSMSSSGNIIFVGKFGNQPLICTWSDYSLNRGETWLPVFSNNRYMVESFSIRSEDNLIFASVIGNLPIYGNKGVMVSTLGAEWVGLGLDNLDGRINFINVQGNNLWAVAGNRIYKTDLSHTPFGLAID